MKFLTGLLLGIVLGGVGMAWAQWNGDRSPWNVNPAARAPGFNNGQPGWNAERSPWNVNPAPAPHPFGGPC